VEAVDQLVLSALDVDHDEVDALDVESRQSGGRVAQLDVHHAARAGRVVHGRSGAAEEQPYLLVAPGEAEWVQLDPRVTADRGQELLAGVGLGLERVEVEAHWTVRGSASQHLLRPAAPVCADVDHSAALGHVDVDEEIGITIRVRYEPSHGQPVVVGFEDRSPDRGQLARAVPPPRGERSHEPSLDLVPAHPRQVWRVGVSAVLSDRWRTALAWRPAP
jgi:hypothetical protein